MARIAVSGRVPEKTNLINGMLFDGVSGIGTVAMPADMQITTKTIRVILTPTRIGSSTVGIFGSNTANWYFAFAGSSYRYSYFNAAGVQVIGNSTAGTAVANIPQEIVMVYSNDGTPGGNTFVDFYKNGVFVNRVTNAGGDGGGAFGGTLTIGAVVGIRSASVIYLAEFYNTALSAQDVADLWINKAISATPLHQYTPNASASTLADTGVGTNSPLACTATFLTGEVPFAPRVDAVGRVSSSGRLQQLIPGKDPFFWVQPALSSSVGPSTIINRTINLAGVGRGTRASTGYTSAYYPTTTTSGGFVAADFDGVFNLMDFSNTADLAAALSAKTNLCFFFVGTWDTLVALKNTVFGVNVGAGGGGNYLLIHSGVLSGSAVLFGMRDSVSGKWGETASGLITAGQRFLLTCWFDGAGAGNADRMKVRINGVERALTFTGTIPPTSLTCPASTTSIFMGTTALITGREWDGKLEFFQGYNVPVDYATEVPAMEAALNSYYSIY